jgi:acetolactate synthase regulatory subunit
MEQHLMIKPPRRAICISLSKRNNDIISLIDAYANDKKLTKCDAVCQIIRNFALLNNQLEKLYLEVQENE